MINQRPEIYVSPKPFSAVGVVEKPLSWLERLGNHTALRRILLLIALATVWQVYATHLNNELLFPTFLATMQALLLKSDDKNIPVKH